MHRSLRKALRTGQSHLYFLKEAKDAYYYYSRRFLSQPHEREFKALKFVPDELPGAYLDVGANQGQSIESIKIVKPRAQVFSFEANPLLVTKLKERYGQRADVTINPFGLSDREQELTLFVPVYRQFVYDGEASFDKHSAELPFSSETLFWFSPEKLELKQFTCKLRPLDGQGLTPLFIKIDVQGYEPQVIRGGLDTIKRHEPILMIEAYHDNPEVGSLLRGLGYKPYLFDETGFYQSDRVTEAVNSILMTSARAATVQLSKS